jgi:hypothetical protein
MMLAVPPTFPPNSNYPDKLACLESQFPGAILPEQTSLPDIPPHHLHGPMPRLIHDRPFRRARDGRASGVTGPQRMACILGGIEARSLCKLLDDSRHIDRR